MSTKINNAYSKKRRRQKLPIIVALVLVLIIAVCAISVSIIQSNNYDYELNYDDMHIPGSSYHILINKNTRALLVEVRHFCSEVDCSTSTDKYGPTILTSEEYTKIFSVINEGGDMQYIPPILESMALDQEPFDGHLVGNATTRREFANQWLDDVIEELHK